MRTAEGTTRGSCCAGELQERLGRRNKGQGDKFKRGKNGQNKWQEINLPLKKDPSEIQANFSTQSLFGPTHFCRKWQLWPGS